MMQSFKVKKQKMVQKTSTASVIGDHIMGIPLRRETSFSNKNDIRGLSLNQESGSDDQSNNKGDITS
jgi:hypothetical protein